MMGSKTFPLAISYLLVTIHSVLSDSHQWPTNGDPTIRNWNHPPSAQSQQQRQNLQSGHQPPTTNLPSDSNAVFQQTQQSRSDADSDPNSNGNKNNNNNGMSRSFDPNDISKTSASSDQEVISRNYGYYGYQGLNVQRFNPNLPHYDWATYPRNPFSNGPHRYGPGYRKDKYGHGYGYSCKQGDDCEQVRAANQFPASQSPPLPPIHHVQHFGSQYPEIPHPLTHFSQYGSQYPPARFHESRFNSPPSHYYPHGRYMHDDVQEQNQQ